MTPEEVTEVIRHTLFLALEISAPILIAMLFVGLTISILQSATQITESTLIFIPKLLCFVFIFALTLPWIIKMMIQYTNGIFVNYWDKVMNVANNVL
jgi:flagellar biosynthesis protein FliQ